MKLEREAGNNVNEKITAPIGTTLNAERQTMKIRCLEEIEARQLARELTQKVYRLTGRDAFSRDFGLKRQIQSAAGSSMHNIAEGFDSETNAEFLRFLRYAKRSCTEVQSELYVAMDQKYISATEFHSIYDHAGRTRATIHGFIRYLSAYGQESKLKSRTVTRKHTTLNAEP